MVAILASAHSRAGDRSQAERAIDHAATLAAALPRPQHPDHHYVFDPPKLDLYASRTYAWLGMPEQVERHARSVLAQKVVPAAD